MEELGRRALMEAPSFGEFRYSTAELPAALLCDRLEIQSDDFNFAFASVDSDDLRVMIADEIFSNGQILPVYPVFNRSLVTGDFESPEMKKSGSAPSSSSSSWSISSEAEDLDGMTDATAACCLRMTRSAPQSPDQWRKSRKTGSSASASRRCRLRDLILGRSRSDGKGTFVMLPVLEQKDKEETSVIGRSLDGKSPAVAYAGESKKKGQRGKGKIRAVGEMDIVTAHRIYYSNGRASSRRRSFLPYRLEILFGFFGNGGRHPF
ncbi:hypothetical protein AXF42_Ash004887 [Apostasia shenzhenica]|uniref:Uncharacterized protein n=1 Tax=Apostasia shenzhenica TaxID=1088818 RepID=A0A2I0B7V2_9ASPA|nr:hypothetical protein AXF42_Ash004887 [Apostasia shenzhenica]